MKQMTEAIWYRLASPPRPTPTPQNKTHKKKKNKKKKNATQLHNHSNRLKSCLYDKGFNSCFRLFYGSLSLICLHSYTCILSKRCNHLNERSPSLFIARTKFTVPFSYSKLSPFREARDALILYIFDDETELFMFLLI